MTDDIRSDEEARQVFTMFSVPFTGVTGGALPASSLQFSGVAMTDNPGESGDIIQIWKLDEGGVNEYYCYPDDGLWYNTMTDALITEDYEDGIPAGTAFWYLVDKTADREGSPVFTVSGAVDNEAFYEWDIRIDEDARQVFTMLANPYPGAWQIADGVCEIEGVAMTDNPGDYGDIIQIWKKDDGGVNEYYCYPDDGLWYNTMTDALITEDYEDGIPAGTAFWYLVDKTAVREGNPSITFYNPIK